MKVLMFLILVIGIFIFGQWVGFKFARTNHVNVIQTDKKSDNANFKNATISPELSLSFYRTGIPGGVARVNIGIRENPKFTYRGNRIPVVRYFENQSMAIVGIPLSAHYGKHSIVDQDNGEIFHFWVKKHKYKKQKIQKTSKITSGVKLERKIIDGIFKTYTMPDLFPLPFIKPISSSRCTSTFGLHRTFNDGHISRHQGLDMAAPIGTKILAPANGKVLKTGNYSYTGKTIFIDHGYGIITLYAHLNKIKVSERQSVKKGGEIGTVGKTGRATGPHLHWGVIINGNKIKPNFVTSPSPC